MGSWDKTLSSEDQRHLNNRHRRESPSFSSTLLDTIYRSIDEGPHSVQATTPQQEELIFYRETMRKKKISSSGSLKQDQYQEEMVNFRRACLIDKWMEKKASSEKVVGRNSVTNLNRKFRDHYQRDFTLLKNTSSSSSDSTSSGVEFSSSESESFHGSKSTPSCYYNVMQTRPKPIRTSTEDDKQKHENSFAKTKSKALKIYGNLKKVKQPISPGGRLANFMNSLLTVVNANKVKANRDLSLQRKSKSANESTCSSSTSFSRSCLSKTPSTRGQLSSRNSVGESTKRSVRFCPVSTVIVDEDCTPCGPRSLLRENEEDNYYSTEENRRRVQEVARELLWNYQKQKEKDNTSSYSNNQLHLRDVREYQNEEDEEEEDDDDAASCSSSDLFELDNLSTIGIDQRYRQELPVYETTHFDTNRAISSTGLIL